MKQPMTQRQLITTLIERQNHKRSQRLTAEAVEVVQVKPSKLVDFVKNFFAFALIFVILFSVALQVLYGLADDIERQTVRDVQHQLHVEWSNGYAK